METLSQAGYFLPLFSSSFFLRELYRIGGQTATRRKTPRQPTVAHRQAEVLGSS
jgi:hypothetical protein